MTITSVPRYDHVVTTQTGEAPPTVAAKVGAGGAEQTRAERRRARIRATIADTALRLFMSRGYDATTVEDVAAAVDLSPRTVFRYFPFKEDMLREAVHFELTELIAALRDRPAHEHPADALGRAMVHIWPRMDKDPEEVRTLLRLISELPRMRGLLVEASRSGQNALAEALAPRLGRSAADLSTQVATGCALAALNIVLETWAAMPASTDLAPLINDAMAAVKAGPLNPLRPADHCG